MYFIFRQIKHYNTNYMKNTIGSKLKELRKKNGGYTQIEFANKLSITYQTYNKYENDRISPKVSNLKEILNIHKVSLGEFFESIML